MANPFIRNTVSMYFSSRGVSLVEQSGGRIGRYATVPYPERPPAAGPVATEDIFDVFKQDDVQIIAFLQKALRDNKIDARRATVSLPPKDLIIRFFEMPNIPRSEVAAGINFEMKKYIPFKIEELAFDFQYRLKPKANIIEVVLCGMRQDPVVKYDNLFKQMAMDVNVFEPGLFSLFRLLVLRKKISNNKSYVVLEFGKEDANILVVDKGFPYFTRDIKLTGGAGAAGKGSEEFDAVLFRLINEVRVSLDYYRRQFMKKDVDEMLVVTEKETSGWVDQLSKELGIKGHYISISDLLKLPSVTVPSMSFDLLKAYGAALKPARPSLVTINLGKSLKEKAKAPGALSLAGGQNVEQLAMLLFSEYRPALMRGAIIGAFCVVIGYGMGFSKVFPLERALASKTIEQPPLIPGVDVSSLDSLRGSETTMIAKEKTFKDTMEGVPFFSRLVAVLPTLMPQGVWLRTFHFSMDQKQMELSCSSYDPEPDRRTEHMNDFLMNLKKSKIFSGYFTRIELLSYREVTEEEHAYLQFEVVCVGK